MQSSPFILTALMVLAAAPRADEIKLLTWPEYLDQSVIDAFQRESGHQIRQFFIRSDTERNTLLAASGAAQFDLIMMDSVATAAYGVDGLIQPLDDKVDNLQLIDDRWRQACGRFGIPYSWGTLGIAYRSSQQRQPIESWRQLFTPPVEFRGALVILPDITAFSAAALLAAGEDPNTQAPEALRQAYRLMTRQQPYVLAYDYSISYALERGESSEMAMALTYSADVIELKEATGQQDWVYTVPKEGTMLWIDCWTAPAGQQIRPAVRDFLAFLNRPEVAAMNAEQTWMATPISAALELTSSAHRQDPELYPPQSVLAHSRVFKPLSVEANGLRAKMVAAVQE